MSGILLEVKKQIDGVKNTRKITKAMQLVAASKMRQFQKRAVSARSYVWDLLALLENNLEDFNENSVYTAPREKGKTLFVLYTSDKGLCGGLNNKLLNGLFRSGAWLNLEPDQRLLMTVGKKARDYARSNKIPLLKDFSGLPEKMSLLDSLKIVDAVLTLWKTEDIKEVKFIAPHYKNSFTFYPVIKTFLPLSEKTVEDTFSHLDEKDKPQRTKDENKFMLFSGSKDSVLETLYGQMVQAIFLQSFLELKASEYSSRMIAMQNATDSADRMTQDLTRVYNKARQQAITQEIAELMGASMALS